MMSADTERILLASAVDFDKADAVETLQHLDIFAEQAPRARIELRLERDANPSGLSACQLGGLKAGPQLRRVVRIVVDQANALNLSVHLPSPRHTGELRKAALDRCKRHVERETRGNACQRIADHVPPRHL